MPKAPVKKCSFYLNKEKDIELIELYKNMENKSEWFKKKLLEYEKKHKKEKK